MTLTKIKNFIDTPAFNITNNISNSNELNNANNASNFKTKIKYLTSSICIETKFSKASSVVKFKLD
ncbi:hypothetical protein Glove_9g76 [Diversispora epigaea]|uniref:Uncharacterized protein n=1 Tax=Diversispora epigaea TaxID=1348612 RepID=A0A397JXF1_9GLOM|nr:hypothetical protein Glove_9g76 [Diversispora epigaea]